MTKMSKVVIFLAKAIAAFLVGDVLFHLIAGLPFDMPFSVEMALKRTLRTLGRGDLTDTDDIEDIAALVVAVVTTAVGVAVVWGGHALIRRLAVRHSHT